MTSSRLADLVRAAIVVPCSYAAAASGPRPSLVRFDGLRVTADSSSVPVYRFVGPRELADRVFPEPDPFLDDGGALARNRRILDGLLDRMGERGLGLLVVPYLDRGYAYVLVQERELN